MNPLRTRSRNPQPVSCGPQPLDAALELRSLGGRHRRLDDADHASSTDHAGQRQGDAEVTLVAGNREDASLVTQDRFRQPRAHDADAVLLTPAVIMTRSAAFRSSYVPSRMLTADEKGAP